MFQRNGKLLYKRFAGYFMPTVLMGMALSMSIVIDGIIVGNLLGAKSLAAVNLVLPVTLAFSVLYYLFGLGGTVVAAMDLGRRDTERANEAYTVSLASLLAAGIAAGVLLLVFVDPLSAFLSGGDAEMEELVRSFLSVLAWGTPFLIVTPGLVYFIRTDGRPGLASVVLITANAINLIGDLIFIEILGDVRGAALGTVVGYMVGTLLLALYYRSPARTFRFRWRPARMPELGAAAVKAGLPSAMEGALLFVKITFINGMVMSIAGSSGLAAFSVCLAALSLVSMFIEGAADTMLPLVGVLYGEEDYRGLRFIVRRAGVIVLLSAAALTLVFELFPVELLGLFGVTGSEDLAVGVPAIRLFAPGFLGVGISCLMLTYYQAVEKSGYATLISVVQGVVVIVPCALVLSHFWGLTGIWLSYPIAEAATLVLILYLDRMAERRSGGAVKGILMLPDVEMRGQVVDVTVAATQDEVLRLVREIHEQGEALGLSPVEAHRVALVVEEMAVNVVKHAHDRPGSHFIDVAVDIKPEAVSVSFRDDGRPFNPLAQAAEGGECIIRGLDLVKAMAHPLRYAYTLNFNNTVVVLDRALPHNEDQQGVEA